LLTASFCGAAKLFTVDAATGEGFALAFLRRR
jgi:hypothetical protein